MLAFSFLIWRFSGLFTFSQKYTGYLLDRVRAQRDAAHAQLRAADARQRAEVAAIAGAEAAIRVAKAQVEIARAAVRQRQAALDFTKVELARTVIRAPLDGVVIGRNVELGQTVAASLQAPTLFTIAQDLRQMQVEANVDEADIGHIEPNQRVTFTVDAYLGRSFRGGIVEIHKAPQVFQNVVTYTVVISAENSDLALLPGMTATVRIVVAEKADVLKVPNAALRFRPPGSVRTAVAHITGRQSFERIAELLNDVTGQHLIFEFVARDDANIPLLPQRRHIDYSLESVVAALGRHFKDIDVRSSDRATRRLLVCRK